MIDFSKDNNYKLNTYRVDNYSDAVPSLLMDGEVIRYAFSGDSVKVFISDKRIIIEEKSEDKSDYSFIGLRSVDYFQMEVKELSRQVSGMELILGFNNGQKLTFTIEDDINSVAFHALLSSNIFT